LYGEIADRRRLLSPHFIYLCNTLVMPKAKSGKQDKSSKTDKSGKQDKGKGSSDDPKKLKAANAIKVRHILCEKQSKSTVASFVSNNSP
jgi:hypothetical protein